MYTINLNHNCYWGTKSSQNILQTQFCLTELYHVNATLHFTKLYIYVCLKFVLFYLVHLKNILIRFCPSIVFCVIFLTFAKIVVCNKLAFEQIYINVQIMCNLNFKVHLHILNLAFKITPSLLNIRIVSIFRVLPACNKLEEPENREICENGDSREHQNKYVYVRASSNVPYNRNIKWWFSLSRK